MRFTEYLIAGVTGLTLGISGTQAEETDLLELGAEIYQNTCHACHDPSASEDDRVAPPIFAAVNHYSDLTDRDAFVGAISSYIVAPSSETSRMPGAVRKFGLMPQQELTEEEARAIATFLFETDFTLPDWYKEHFQQEHGQAPKEN